MSIPFLFNLINLARKKQDEEQAFSMYCAVLPHLDKPQSFDEWYGDRQSQARKEQRKQQRENEVNLMSKDDIMKDLLGGGS